MKKNYWLIVVLVLIFTGHSASAEQTSGLLQRSESQTDRLQVSIFPGLKQPSRKWHGVSFAPQPVRSEVFQQDHAANETQHLSNQLEPLPIERPANNLLRIRF